MGTQFNGPQSTNQIAQGPVVGELDYRTGSGQTEAGIIDSSSAGNLLPGTPITVIDSGGGVVKVKEAALNTDDVYGFICFDKKWSLFQVGDVVDIAHDRNVVMYMVAAAAIARNAKVEVVINLAAPTVQTQTATHTIVGRLKDKAFAAGDLVRVEIDLPGVTPQP